MPFRATFACLWCGTDHATRGPDDLEGWAHLCPTCVGKAGENNFLRSRLRQGLRPSGRAGSRAPVAHRRRPRPRRRSRPHRPAIARPPAPDEPDDDWYLRRGSASQGPIHDAAFLAELDAAGRWLDTLPLRGAHRPAARPGPAGGHHCWQARASCRCSMGRTAALDRARERLVAHGLRAHLHVRDPWAAPEQAVDAILLSRWLGELPVERRLAALAIARAWLRPGGRLVVIDALAPPPATAAAEPDGAANAGFVTAAEARAPRSPPRASSTSMPGRPVASWSSRRPSRLADAGRRRDVPPGSARPASVYSPPCPPWPRPRSRPSAPASWPRP